ncbi:MAG: alanine--tRNA ligase [Candidatus Omnitrophota bacterium]
MQADLLRKKFLDFFKAKKHRIVESDSLVPKDDPTVLFTPAGMNQFKKEFLGFDAGFKRAATSQRCLRTDDLDKVGKTAVHHTFFEMLGNFSFGDYFKKEAISWAWEFLTVDLKINPDKLWVSVYHEDEEAYKIWKDLIKVPVKKIVKLGDKENFWPAEAKTKGPNGPCGPCSEIFFDFGEDVGCKEKACDPSCNCGRFAEIWNLVFTQFNRKEGGVLETLPNKNIDTGMGLERLAAVMQGKKNNFETELFRPLIMEISSGAKDQGKNDKKIIYAVSDHLRAIVFAIYDGVMPSNEARGYVIRKLIRKCSMHLRALGIKKPFLYKLVPVLAEIMRESYPELKDRQENIAQIILSEEKGFLSTLNSSDSLFKNKFKEVAIKEDPEKAGELTFQLYDTYGIPFELTSDWLEKNKIKISIDVFRRELEKQKTRSQLQSVMKGDVFDIKDLHLGAKATKFLGYAQHEVKAKIIKIVKDQAVVKKISKGEKTRIILDQTPFYPESGGQVADTGEFIKGKNIFQVQNTKKFDKVIVHTGIVKEGAFKAGDLVLAKIDLARRLAIARNHTATHLLQAALRKILGKHVKQQGSLVAEDRLRFDFTHFQDVKEEELARVEEEVNNYILDNHTLKAKEMTLSMAKKTGALAFFGEKYGDKVRVVEISDLSKEFCGGTHLDATGQIGLFKILQEGSVASGVRRIEATTGKSAYQKIKEEEAAISDIVSDLGVPADRIAEEVEKRINRIKDLEKALNLERSQIATQQTDELKDKAENINGVDCILYLRDNLDMDFLRKHVDLLKAKKDSNTLIALGANNNGSALLVIGITNDLVQKGLDASILIREAAKFIGGSGGGRKDFAQAGGDNPQGLTQAFEAIKSFIGKIK